MFNILYFFNLINKETDSENHILTIFLRTFKQHIKSKF
jgi:hypothetical protein